MSVAHWATVSDARERRDTHHDVLRPGRHGDRHMLLPRMHRGRCGGRVASSVGVRRVDVSARISTPRRGSIFYEWEGHAELALVSAAASGNLSVRFFFVLLFSFFREASRLRGARESISYSHTNTSQKKAKVSHCTVHCAKCSRSSGRVSSASRAFRLAFSAVTTS